MQFHSGQSTLKIMLLVVDLFSWIFVISYINGRGVMRLLKSAVDAAALFTSFLYPTPFVTIIFHHSILLFLADNNSHAMYSIKTRSLSQTKAYISFIYCTLSRFCYTVSPKKSFSRLLISHCNDSCSASSLIEFNIPRWQTCLV